MPSTKTIKRIAIVGGSVIGASWAAYHLACKRNVVGKLSDRTLECLFYYPGPCGIWMSEQGRSSPGDLRRQAFNQAAC